MNKKSALILHIALVLYCLAIFILSSIPGDNFPEVDFKYTDKLVHAAVYLVLCLLFFYSLKNQSKNVKLKRFAAEFAVLFTVLYGITDEIHQYFVPNRNCELSDWIADAAGAVIAYMIIKLMLSKLRSSVIPALVLAFMISFTGCSSQNNTGTLPKIKASITQQEAWLNLMPVVDETKNNFGFAIEVDIDGKGKPSEYSVSNLAVAFDNGQVRNARFSSEFSEIGDKIKLNLSQAQDGIYLESSKEYPVTASFSFDIYRSGKKILTLTTKTLPINKVY